MILGILRITESEYLYHVDNNNGVCLGCGSITDGGVEPDATNYLCEYCNRHEVCGMEEALLSGYIEFTEEDEEEGEVI